MRTISSYDKIEVDGKTYTAYWVDPCGPGRRNEYSIQNDDDEIVAWVDDTMTVDEIATEIRSGLFLENDSIKITEICGALFDGGWRKEDCELIMNEYNLNRSAATKICEILEDIEKGE